MQPWKRRRGSYETEAWGGASNLARERQTGGENKTAEFRRWEPGGKGHQIEQTAEDGYRANTRGGAHRTLYSIVGLSIGPSSHIRPLAVLHRFLYNCGPLAPTSHFPTSGIRLFCSTLPL